MRFRHLLGVDTAALDGTTADDEAADHGATPTDVGDAVAIADAVAEVEVATR